MGTSIEALVGALERAITPTIKAREGGAIDEDAAP